MADTEIVVYDECWEWGKTLEDGNLVVEVQLLKVSKTHLEEVVHLPADAGDHGNVYSRYCLSCAIGPCSDTYGGDLIQEEGLSVTGINPDNLDACYPSWRDELTELNPWKFYPKRNESLYVGNTRIDLLMEEDEE